MSLVPLSWQARQLLRGRGMGRVPLLGNFAKYMESLLVPWLAKLQGWHFGPYFSQLSERTRSGFVYGTYEEATVLACMGFLRPGMVALDVGASFGFFSRRFSRLVGPRGRVYAFEPHPEIFRLLCKNLRGCENTVPLQKAVSNAVGTVEFLDVTSPTLHSFYDVSRPSHGVALRDRLRVESTTIDSFLADHGGVPENLLIKLDIEGAEPRALAGAAETITRVKNLAMILEYHPFCLKRAGVKPAEFLDHLRALGLALQVLGSSVDELLARREDDDWHVNLLCRKGGA